MHPDAPDKSATHRLPKWLLIAVTVLVTQLLVSVGLDPQPRDLIRTAVGIVLVGLLIWGSRVAWVVVVLGTLYQIGSSFHSAQWRLVTGAAIALCLFAPSSMRYVWMAQARQSPKWIGQRTLELYVRIRTLAYAMAHQLVGWDDGDSVEESQMRQRSYRVGLWRFGIACLVLLFLGGAIVNWQESSGGDSAVLDVVGNGVWICYVFAQLTFIVFVVLAVRGLTTKTRLHSRQHEAKGDRVP